MAVNRMDRIDSEIKKTLSSTIAYNLKNPVFDNAIISVTKVSTTPDLKFCKVYLSIFPDNKKEEIFYELKNCIPFIRKTIAKKINLRVCPEFHLLIDDSLEYSQKMDKLFEQIESSEGGNDK